MCTHSFSLFLAVDENPLVTVFPLRIDHKLDLKAKTNQVALARVFFLSQRGMGLDQMTAEKAGLLG